MPTNFFFSVVLSNYNGEEFIGEAIESVLAQSYKDFELIVYDDGSTDGSLKVVESFLPQSCGRLKVIKAAQNKGQAAGFNAGVAESRGKWIAFLDSDDLWYPKKLEEVQNAILGNEGCAFHMHHLNPLRNGQIDRSSTIPRILTAGDVYGEALESCKIPRFVSTSGLCFSKDVLTRVGEIPEAFKLCADGYLTRTSMCYGRVLVTDQALGAYREHSSNNVLGNSLFRGHTYQKDLLVPHLHRFYEMKNLPLRYSAYESEFRTNGSFISTLGLERGDRVIVIRSAPPDEMDLVLSHLKNAKIQTELWVQSGLQDGYRHKVDTLEPIRVGGFSRHTVSAELISKTQKSPPKCVLLVYLNANMHEDYHNIHACLSYFSLGCPIVGIEPRHGNMYSIDQNEMRRRVKKEPSLLSGPFNAPWTEDHYKENSYRLATLRDKFKGRRGFIIGTGPSLMIEDLNRLKDEVTFACNKIFLAYEDTDWRPTVYSVCDEMVAKNIKEHVYALTSVKVLSHSVRKYLWEDSTSIFVNPQQSSKAHEDAQGWNLVSGVNAGHTVLNLHIKIAYWMGIRELYIIGADHCFQVPDTKTGERLMNNDVIVGEGEVNHFHRDYRPSGEKWTVPQYAKIEYDFAESRRIFESAGGRIYNASRKSKLDVFERVDLDEILIQ